MAAFAIAGVYKGVEARKMKYREGEAYLDAANRRMAAMTRDVAEESRRKDAMRGRALAVTAASGGGVDTPTVMNLIGDLNAEGEYRIMSAMFLGQNEAAGLTYRAEAARREGDAAFASGVIEGVTSAISFGYASGAFGGKTPPPTATAPSATVGSVPTGAVPTGIGRAAPSTALATTPGVLGRTPPPR